MFVDSLVPYFYSRGGRECFGLARSPRAQFVMDTEVTVRQEAPDGQAEITGVEFEGLNPGVDL